MRAGTKTLLFGVHQFVWHPLLVLIAWIKLYKEFPSIKELICIFIHDWGYWQKKVLKDEDGDRHPELGAKIAGKLLGPEWRDFVLGHSSYYVLKNGIETSKLMAADKYFHCIIPLWMYKAMAVPTGEFKYYREMDPAKYKRQVADKNKSDEFWWLNLQKICLKKIIYNRFF